MFKRACIALIFFISLLPGLSLGAQNKMLQIAAAADLQPVLPKVVAEFEKTTGTQVKISYASSATLATQILNGAPFDLFLAANMAFPQRVIDANLATETVPVPYAEGTLVLWVRRAIGRDPLTMQFLKDPAILHIAIANPEHAPYGAAAMAALHTFGLADILQPKLVFAENIAQAAEFAYSSNADCALISKTFAQTASMESAGRFVIVPKDSYPAIEQGAVVMRNSSHRTQAQDFLSYLESPAGRQKLAAGGLGAVPSK